MDQGPHVAFAGKQCAPQSRVTEEVVEDSPQHRPEPKRLEHEAQSNLIAMSGHDCAVLGQSLLVVAKLVSNGEPLTGSILGPCERPYTFRLEIPGMVGLRECRRIARLLDQEVREWDEHVCI